MCIMAELAAIARRCVAYLCHALILIRIGHFSALTFVLAPLPNALFSHCGSDDLSFRDEGSAPVDIGRFITSIFVITGFALPIVLAHSDIIDSKACAMSIAGGG
jgi:VPS55-like protein